MSDIENHPHYATVVVQLDAVRKAFEKTLSAFYMARPDDFEQATSQLDRAVESLRTGIGQEVVRAGEPESDPRALILETLGTYFNGVPMTADALYREVINHDPRLRDRQEPNERVRNDDIDTTLPNVGGRPTHRGPIWDALQELQAEGLVESIKPGGGYTRKYRLSKKAKEAARV